MQCRSTYNHCHFHCAPGFDTPVLAHMLDSLVRVSRRGKENHFVKTQSARTRILSKLTNLDQCGYSANSQQRIGNINTHDTGFLRFHFSNFRYSLTLFSKFFASFPHGTCSLSVSHQYLALDGIYHPLRAAIPNNSTRRLVAHLARRTGVSPSQLPCSKGLGPASNATVDRPQFGATRRRFTS